MNNEISNLYQQLSEDLVEEIDTESWSKLMLSASILNKDASNIRFTVFSQQNEFDKALGFEKVFSINDLLVALRNLMLDISENRIWGLTFTLYPNGKFEIEFDYNKPEGYEETDEVITGEEINRTFLK